MEVCTDNGSKRFRHDLRAQVEVGTVEDVVIMEESFARMYPSSIDTDKPIKCERCFHSGYRGIYHQRIHNSPLLSTERGNCRCMITLDFCSHSLLILTLLNTHIIV